MRQEYPELINKEVTWHYPDYPEQTETGKIADIDRSVGITIVNVNNPDEKLTCINGPSSPHWNDFCERFDKWEEEYNNIFDHCVKMIEDGVYKSYSVNTFLGIGDSRGVITMFFSSDMSCAFS